jgi:hypothetical protein
MRFLTNDPENHPFRNHMLDLWCRADERGNKKDRERITRVIRAMDDICEIYKARQLAFSGAAFVVGFVTATLLIH